jgi:glycosyltransferase involved in cell wall biosynthesis
MTTTRSLNVVHVCDHLGWAGSRMHGVKRLFAWMLPRFDRTRVTASLVSLRGKDLSEDTLEQLGIDVTYLGRHKFDPATFTHLLKVLRDKRADVVHLHGYGATTFGRLCAAWMRIPAILHEHANHTDTPWFQKLADRTLAPHTDVAIAVSASTAEFTTRARLVPANRTHVVYLGAPLDEFARPRSVKEIAAARRALGVPDGAVAIGCVTRLMPAKGNEYLVAAAPAVLAAHPQARFYLVGEGELDATLKAQAARLGLGDRFVFAGFTRDVAAAFSAFDVVVFPSLWEGTPLTAFEALAMGKPIVSTNADGLLDVLTHDRDALVVPTRDSAALAAAITRVIGDPVLRSRLAAGARATGQCYDIGVFVRKMERLYELLHESSARTRRQSALTLDLSFLHDGARP